MLLDSKTALILVDLQKGIDHPSQGVRNNHRAEETARGLLEEWRARAGR